MLNASRCDLRAQCVSQKSENALDGQANVREGRTKCKPSVFGIACLPANNPSDTNFPPRTLASLSASLRELLGSKLGHDFRELILLAERPTSDEQFLEFADCHSVLVEPERLDCFQCRNDS